MTHCDVEFRNCQAMANWLKLHPIFSAIADKAFILAWVTDVTSMGAELIGVAVPSITRTEVVDAIPPKEVGWLIKVFVGGRITASIIFGSL